MLERLAAEGNPVPDDPGLPEWLEPAWRGFMTLGPMRGYSGMGDPMPLTFESLDRYAARAGLAGDRFEEFTALVHALDAEWFDLRRRSEG